MINKQNLILSAVQIDQKIVRMAYEIYENHLNDKHLIFTGISENGYFFANKVSKHLQEISPIETTVLKIDINKDAPFTEDISIGLTEKELKNKSIVIFDDVLNSGKTIAYTLKGFLNANISKIEVAVMVNRHHKAFPIYPKYKGYELATSINERVEVHLKGTKKGVYLY